MDGCLIFFIIIHQRSSSLKILIDLFSQCCANLSNVVMRKYVYLYLPLISSAMKNSKGFAHYPFIHILVHMYLAKVPKMYLGICTCCIKCVCVLCSASWCNGGKPSVLLLFLLLRHVFCQLWH